MEPIRVFLGYDEREPVAYHAAAHSIHRFSSVPVTIAPLMLGQLRGIFDRPRDPKQSTDFAFTRFLVPYLCDYRGWALFADSDILFRRDIRDLWDLRDERFAVQVVQHEHVPQESIKFLGQTQTSYPRKNWSSFMQFNNERCRALTPEYVATAKGLDLHQFAWLSNEGEIGALPKIWNHLVDYDPARPVQWIANLHYTSGGPWFADCRGRGYEQEWWDEFHRMLGPLAAEIERSRPMRAAA